MKKIKQLFIACLPLLLLANSCRGQSEIKEHKAQENIYLVGDRVYSLYYITPKGVVVIDPINEIIAEETLKSIRRHTDLPILHVIYSHNHWDHNMGGKIFEQEGATFIAHEKAVENWPYNKRVVSPDSTWSGKDATFDFHGSKIELFFYGKNHGDGMTVFRFPEYNAVFAVDLVVPDRVLYAYLPDAQPKQWLNHLYEMEKLKFEHLYMAHVRPIGSRKDLVNQIRYFEDLYKATEDAIDQGIPLLDIPNVVRLPEYKDLLNYDEWLHLNVWRILMEKSIGQ